MMIHPRISFCCSIKLNRAKILLLVNLPRLFALVLAVVTEYDYYHHYYLYSESTLI